MSWKEVHELSKPKQIKLIRKFHASCKIGATPSTQAIERNIKEQKNNSGKLFDEWPQKRQDDYYISKIQALQIASIIRSSKNRNEIISIIFAYAASLGLKDLFEASVYAKIY